MFNSYINDLPNLLESTHIIKFLFADDCCLLFARPDAVVLNSIMNEGLVEIKDYFDANLFSI